MDRKALSGIMLAMLLTGMLTLAFNVQPVEGGGTVYIRPDGSVDPSTTPIHRDRDVYTFTGNINDSIVVERDNIVVDGAGYALHGTGSGTGIDLSDRNNITIKNVKIKEFAWGIIVFYSSTISISGNNITNNGYGINFDHSSFGSSISGNNITANNHLGIWLHDSSTIGISGNNITANNERGIYLTCSSKNSISGNNITDNYCGVELDYSSSNSISGNNVANNMYGICLSASSSNNSISANNIANNHDGMKLWGSSKNSISGNNITNNGYIGILLGTSSNNTLSGNNIINNDDAGISLLSSSDNTVSRNNIIDNGYGVWLSLPFNNTFCHNNFIDNSEQVYIHISRYTNFWDDGYPSGGNYWSDYTDVDLYCGPNQDVPGSDGIWDHEYVMDTNNKDDYPLVKPYVLGDLSVSIYTDKYTYHAGDTMHLGLNVTNPDSVKYVCFAIWAELPDSEHRIYVYMHRHSVVLPIGLNYANPAFDSITLSSLPSGTYTWHVAFLKRATHTIIVEHTAEWEFV